MMKPEEKSRIAGLYASRLAAKEPPHKIVGWGSKSSQELRFRVLSEISNLEGANILDVGSGLSDLYFYLRDQGTTPGKYLGVDISEPLIAEATARLADLNGATAQVADILIDPISSSWDFVLCSGALNLKIEKNWEHTQSMLQKMYSLAKKGVACNFLSTYVDFAHDKDFHHLPERVFSFARSLTPRLSLRHDYPLYEFTIYLYKDRD